MCQEYELNPIATDLHGRRKENLPSPNESGKEGLGIHIYKTKTDLRHYLVLLLIQRYK